MEMYDPPHPGALVQEWIEGLNTNVTRLANHIGVSRGVLSRIEAVCCIWRPSWFMDGPASHLRYVASEAQDETTQNQTVSKTCPQGMNGRNRVHD